MIESNIVQWVDLGDTMQNLDVYGKTKWVRFFNLFRVLINFKKFSLFFYIVLKCFFFLQIAMLNLTNVNDTSDSAVQILKYISNVIFIQDIITDSASYKIAVIINSVLTFVTILCIVYLMISVKIEKFYMKIPIVLLNLINAILMNYLIGPIIQISVMVTKCNSGVHMYLNETCYSNYLHIIFVIVSLINLIFFIIYSIILSIYYNEIGSINEAKFLARINCNYEIYTNLSKISIFIFAYFVKFYGSDSDIYKILLEIYLVITTLIYAMYCYRSVLFYDSRINATILYGWIFLAWFAVVVLLKTLLKINDTTIFHIVGWLIISLIVYYMEEFKEEYLLTDFNIFEAKSLKDIELFNMKLFNLMNMRSMKNKTLLVGIINKFEELVKTNEDLQEKYTKLSSNEHLKKKFNSNSALSILSIVYIIYDHHLDKSLLKNDILLNICYFLMNRFKNVTYAVYLCSKIKAVSHKHLYFKYLLMEEIKAYQIAKLSKSNNKESIKHVQIGSVILYNIYMELFKSKIYEAVSGQIDYFDLLRNNITTSKTTESFLKLGEEILSLRKEILKLWQRIIELNPFSEDMVVHYSLYLETILQDEILARTENKKFTNFRTSKLSERNNIYHSMFNSNAAIILVDGYSNFGKVLYTTPSFPYLFGFSQNGKEVLNMSVDDFVPNVMREYHKDLIENGIRFSNLNYIFSSQRDMLIKGKSGSIHNVKLYLKCVPNLSYGLIYMVSITKIIDQSYIIVLDKEFKINGMTDMFNNPGNQISYSTHNYALDRNVVNHHLGMVIPEFLLELEYREDIGFHVPKSDTDLKGVLYSLPTLRGLTERIERLLERIRQNGKLENDENRHESLQDYEDFVNELSNKSTKRQSVFYKIITRNFLEGKYTYHRVYISNDLITMNENSQSFPSNFSSHGNDAYDRIPNKRNNNMKSNNKLTNVNVAESHKHIKIKLHQPSGEEREKLIEEGDVEGEKEKKKGEEEMKENAANENMSHFSSQGAKSAFSRSSVDSASFNKLKNGILEKKEVSSIKFMRYLSFVFGIGTILLVYFAQQQSNKIFGNLNSYLLQNLFFNHSKIAVSCVYLATMNLKFLKYDFYDENHCYKPCKDFYSSLLSECIGDIEEEKENATHFYSDFKKVLAKQKIIDLELYNLTKKNQVTIDVENELNLLVSYGLKLISNLDDYFEDPVSTINTVSNNILGQSLLYLSDEAISGFNENQKEINLSQPQFSPVNIILIIEGVLFSVLLVGFVWLICSLFRLESFYLKKLIKFRNPPFDAYLKNLEAIKQQNNKNDAEEEVKDDFEMQEFVSKKGSKRGEETDGKEDKKDKKKKKNDDGGKGDKNEEKDKMKGHGRKKSNKKATKNYQDDKINIMGNFFLYWNLFFLIKVLVILLLSISYYLILSVIDSSTKTQLLTFDSTSNGIESVYKSSFDIYLSLKTELSKYIDYEITKKKLAQYLDDHPGATVEFEGAQYSDSLTLKTGKYYFMDLPKQVEVPKTQNVLMPIINTNLTYASEAIIKLNNLYQDNGCAVLFDKTTHQADYNHCSTFWSSILVKGMDQSITQMSVVVTTVLDDLHSLNLQKKELSNVISSTSPFGGYELFVEFYLFKSYMTTVEIFRTLNEENLLELQQIYLTIMIGYCVFVVFLFGFLLYFVYKSKGVFNTFMNFIGILPAKYLIEDSALYKEILKLEQYIYY